MRSLYHHAIPVGLIALSACATQSPPSSQTPAPAASSAQVIPVAAPEPDLSPVAAPKTTVFVARWLNADTSFKTIEKLGKLPIPIKAMLEKGEKGKELVALLKLDSPIDAVAMIDPSSSPDNPKPMAAFSLPLRDMKEALAAVSRKEKPTQLRPGIYRLRREENLACDLSVSVGDAPARVICSQDDRDLDALVPWMTRSLPNEKLGEADLHVELRAEGLRQRYKEELEQYGPALPELATKALQEAGIKHQGLLNLVANMAGDAPKLVADIDTFSLDFRLEGETSEITTVGSVHLKSTNSWVSRVLTQRNDKAGPPPAIFWQAPKDSDSVSFNRGSDPKFFDGVRETLSSGVAELLSGKLDGADVRNISDLFTKVPLIDPQAVVIARGHLTNATKEKEIKKGEYKPADAIQDTQNQVRNFIGWSLVGIETKSDAYADWLKNLVKAYNSRTLQGTIKKEMGKDKPIPTAKIVAAPPGAPKGTLAVEFAISISSKDIWYSHGRRHDYREHPKKDAKGILSFLVTISPDGNRTWIGVSADSKSLGSHLAAVKDGAPKEGTIASRPGLDELKNSSLIGGGFLALGGFLDTANGSFSDFLSRGERRRLKKVLSILPNKGDTPILLMATGTTGPSPTNRVEVHLQKGSVDDLASMIVMAFTASSDSSDPPEISGDGAAPPPPFVPPPPPPPVPPPPPPPAPHKKKLQIADGGDNR